jgi:DNA-binding NtrC family response regulator
MARIFLIDKDDSARTVLYLTLAYFGHTVIEARGLHDGPDLFNHANADLIIADIVKPEKEGLKFLTKLMQEHPSVKVIAISGEGLHTAEDFLHKAKLAGTAKILVKPVSDEAMMAAVNELLLPAGPPARPTPGTK